MSIPLVVVLLIVGSLAGISGWAMIRASSARSSGAFLTTAGVLVIAATGIQSFGGDGRIVFTVAGQLVLPIALLLYPTARLRSALSFILIAVTVGVGVMAVIWAEAAWSFALVAGAALLIHAWAVLERGKPNERRAMIWASVAWLGTGLASAFLVFVFSASGVTDSVALVVEIACFVPAPVATAIGVVRPDLLDVRGIVTSVVVTGTVVLTFVALGVGITEFVRVISGRPLGIAPTIVLCAVLALGVQPLRVLLRGIVDQLLFGDRPDPLVAATTLADRIGEDPAVALAALRDALVLPYAALIVNGETLVSSGTAVTHTRAVPLHVGDDGANSIVVGLRAGDLALSKGDENVLRIVAPLLAQVIRSERLTAELSRSRGIAIAGIEEERRRLRRDLHDGLGPTLTGVAYAADAARNQLGTSPEKAEALIAQLRADTADAIAEVRRLVDGLRPPALDELGLVGSIRAWAGRLHTAQGSALTVHFDATELPIGVSAAQEVAAYRIAVEALTNVARHSGSSSAFVQLATNDDWLLLTVRDDGPIRDWIPGTGIASMHERAEQVGGTLTIDDGAVRARIPLLGQTHEPRQSITGARGSGGPKATVFELDPGTHSTAV